MTFAEADAQYEVVRQQYLGGMLDDEQYDEQLHRLMVLDDEGKWWAKSRENGVWHYYDSVRGDWVAAAPPTPAQPPGPPGLPGAASKQGKTKGDKSATPPAEPQRAAPVQPGVDPSGANRSGLPAAGAASGTQPFAKGTETNLPRWAAVKPGTAGASTVASVTGRSAARPAAGAGTASVLPGTAQGAPGTNPYSARDFGPIADLTGSMKVLFYVLSLLLPFLGIILFFLYRNKPAESDQAAARVCLILGIVSIVFTGMCITTFFVFESLMLGTGI
jgi:hypothetical protein